MLSSLQCRMARTGLDLGVRELASVADVSPNTVARLERGENLHRRTLAHLRGVLEALGAVFIEASEASSFGGAGVRIGDDPHRSRRADLMLALWSMRERLRHEPIKNRSRSSHSKMTDLVALVLSLVEAEGREPDDWEKIGLLQAIAAIGRGHLSHALVEVFWSITPPDNRSSDYVVAGENSVHAKNFDICQFRKALRQLRASFGELSEK